MRAAKMAEMTLATDPTLPGFLLGHLDALAKQQAAASDPRERVALGIALFSAFLDCVELGLHDDARRIMGQFHSQSKALAHVAA